MDKRGVSHTDWAISMAIFIVYILLMIIFLKPGVAPIYKPEGLMQLVEENFFEETNWVVRETWLDIKKCTPKANAQANSYDSCEIAIEERSGNWNLKLVTIDDLEKPVTNPLSFGQGYVSCNFDSTDNSRGLIENKKMRIVYSLKPPENKNREEELVAGPPKPNEPGICEIGKLGASIESTGLSTKLVDYLKSKPKTHFTTDGWGFPDNKGFKIVV